MFDFLRRREKETTDARRGRFLAVIECHLNQNVRDDGTARFPAMNVDFVRLCERYGVGLMSIPCPEIEALGTERRRPRDTTIREALENEPGQSRCFHLAERVAARIDTRERQGAQLVAIVGGNPKSPGCAVHCVGKGLTDESGVFMKALETALNAYGPPRHFMALRDHDPAALREDLDQIEEALATDNR